MSEGLFATAGPHAPAWPGWCCSYCSGPLQAEGHGVSCAREGRWFATQAGVHRLLTEQRRRELQPAIEAYQRMRREEGWRAERGLPDVGDRHPHAATWSRRARQFARAVGLAEERLGRGPWRVLDAGAGCCWASARLLEAGHAVAAVDVNLDDGDGLLAAGRLLDDPSRLPRAELPALFEGAGWRLEEHGWPGRLREVAHDLVEAGLRGMPAARFPILIGRRDG